MPETVPDRASPQPGPTTAALAKFSIHSCLSPFDELDQLMKGAIYLIEEAWADPLENEVSAAFGYKPIGYVMDEKDARNIVKSGGNVSLKFSWALTESFPKFRYKSLPQFDITTIKT